jgi:hypothetical protein
MEEWRDVVGSPGYKVSNLGRVLGPRGRVLKPQISKRGGYPTVMVWGNRTPIHVLVLETFVGPRPEWHEGRHLDGVPTNSVLCNLAWGTKAQNYDDARRHGTNSRGEVHGQSKLTEQQVVWMRQAYAAGLLNGVQIAAKLGVSYVTVYDALKGKTWTHV